MEEKKDFIIKVLLDLLAASLLAVFYLAYQLALQRGMDHDLEKENIALARRLRECEKGAG